MVQTRIAPGPPADALTLPCYCACGTPSHPSAKALSLPRLPALPPIPARVQNPEPTSYRPIFPLASGIHALLRYVRCMPCMVYGVPFLCIPQTASSTIKMLCVIASQHRPRHGADTYCSWTPGGCAYPPVLLCLRYTQPSVGKGSLFAPPASPPTYSCPCSKP